MQMKVICAWCLKDMGTKECLNSGLAEGEEPVSHGLCPECKVKVMAEIEQAFAEIEKPN